jgi:uncharacterized repeat protein (TIGR02543 family)
MKYQTAFTASLCVILLLLSAGCEQTTSSGYTIIFDSQGADIAADPDTMKADLITKLLSEMPTDPEKYGYSFGGWWTAPEGSGESFSLETEVRFPTIVYAFWDLESYTISYQLNGGTNNPANPASYTSESETIVPAAPTRAGYTFLGWFEADSGTPGTAVTQISAGSTGDISLEARWDTVSYTISYVLHGGTNNPANPASYTTSDTTDLTNPSKTGYTFLGWFEADSGTPGTAITQISAGSTGDISLEARWEINDYTISYVLNGGTNNPANPASYTSESETIVPAAPTRAGYTFEGWYRGETLVEAIDTSIMSDIELTAEWSANDYQLSFNANGGGSMIGDMDPPPVPPVTMFTGEEISLFELTLGIMWGRDGYTLSGWATTAEGPAEYSDQFAVFKMGPRDTILYAQWTPEIYSITYHLNGGINAAANPATYTTESDTIVFAEPTKDEHSFIGWFIFSSYPGFPLIEKKEIPKASTGDVSVKACWEQIAYPITYILNGGEQHTSNPDSYSISTEDIALYHPTKPGYSFLGWFRDSDTGPVTTIPAQTTGSITLEAQWEIDTYSITYQLNGGTSSNANPESFTIETAAFTLENPVRSGYTFLGWFDDATDTQVTIFSLGSTGDKTFEARWELTNYSITYQLDGGTNADTNPGSFTIEAAAIILDDPQKAGYTFLGWFEADSGTPGTAVTQIPAGSTGDISLEARWDAVSYTISYVLHGGTNNPANPASYTTSDTTDLANPSKTGYTFLGWFEADSGTPGTAITQIPAGSTGDISLDARWEINDYTVTYHANSVTSGSVPASQTYSYGSSIQLLELDPDSFPFRTGYWFEGWNTKPDGSGTDYYAGVWDSNPDWHYYDEDLDLYTKWTPLPHYLKFNANGGSGSMDSLKVASNESITLPELAFSAPSKYHYFAGWAESTSGPVVYPNKDSYTMAAHQYIATEITLYAKWNVLQVGDRGPGGGYIFYDKGNTNDGWRYKEWAPYEDWRMNYNLQPYSSSRNVNNMNSNYGTEWRVPTRDEFKQIFNKLYLTGIAKVDYVDYYWTDDDFLFDVIIDDGIIWDTIEEHTGCYMFKFIDPDSYDEYKCGWVKYSSGGGNLDHMYVYEDVNDKIFGYVRPMRRF